MSAPTNKNSSARSNKIESSEFTKFCKKNEFKYLKLYPYLTQVEKTLKMK